MAACKLPSILANLGIDLTSASERNIPDKLFVLIIFYPREWPEVLSTLKNKVKVENND